MTTEKGTFLRYVDRRFEPETLEVIRQANAIIKQYDLALTLRQLYYQFVARGLLPNTVRSYNRLGNIINGGRLAGLISWTAIEDRTRSLRGLAYQESPLSAIDAARDTYRRDLWATQPYRPEVWIEKIALESVIALTCNNLRVDYYASRGYNSQSEQWRAGQRFARYIQKGQRPIVFHLGDHDPSGVDMTRDNTDRLAVFAGVPVQVVRLALNMEQVERYNPPPNPAKMSDSRAAGYVDEFGSSSWELDALDPAVLQDLIRSSVAQVRDETLWQAALQTEAEDLRALDTIIEEL